MSSIPGGTFTPFSGTSMAAPHVAGLYAALKAANPPALTVADASAWIVANGVDMSLTKVSGSVKRINVPPL